jgi:hypothetical protein
VFAVTESRVTTFQRRIVDITHTSTLQLQVDQVDQYVIQCSDLERSGCRFARHMHVHAVPYSTVQDTVVAFPSLQRVIPEYKALKQVLKYKVLEGPRLHLVLLELS